MSGWAARWGPPDLGIVLGIFLGVGLVYKLSAGLAAGLSGGEITMKTRPNEGIHRSARMAVISGLGSALGVGLLGGLGGALGIGLGGALSSGLNTAQGAVFAGLMVGPLIGLAIGLRYGGRACLQHLVLRLALRYHGSIPRHYVDFLDYAAERLFLRRVGSGYIFIHRLLQEYFATMYQADRGDSPPRVPPTAP